MFRTGAIAIVSTLIGGVATPIGAEWVRSDAAPPPFVLAATPVLAADHKGGAIVRIMRHPDGLFHVPVTIAGERAWFVVDTGASVTVLNAADMDRFGLAPADTSRRAVIRTAAGLSPMRWATIPTLRVAGRDFHDVDVAVIDRGLPHSLLGQDVLRAMGVLRIEGDVLEIS